ncbi:hypothetical protein [Staphylococcus phage vB_SauM-T-SE-E1]|nr:hypothetical protein [Staphylococcus phage vB_SauM-V1SA15]
MINLPTLAEGRCHVGSLSCWFVPTNYPLFADRGFLF